jgi:3-deoxy-D-manno-octulosonic-acid transferase
MLARQEFPSLPCIFYFPFDWQFCVDRFLDRIQPRAVVLMETELWPNFLRRCTQGGIPVYLANGRLSEKSFSRYCRVRSFVRSMVQRVEVIGVQTHEDKRRFLQIGAKEEQVRVTGNMKFDFSVPALEDKRDMLEKIRSCLRVEKETPVIVAGSSMKGEEALFLAAFRQVRETIADVRLILAPRHPERFSEVAQLLRESSLPFRRRTELDGCAGDTRPAILLLDTIGELRAVYSLASVALVGGSFLPFGGHNLLEPAALGKAIVFGPDMANFKEMARLFLHEQAARQTTAASLAKALTDLLGNPKSRNILGHRALSTLRQNQGATSNTLSFLLPSVSRKS